ncbi:MAG: S8 family serine peptidase, partial [Candidatus Cloacimonetes bacterium]|nr:S8 family serine peptidase [Candidatus Cloacimonadota bacterium]
MKRFFTYITILMFLIGFISVTPLYAGVMEVVRGERPFIDIYRVPDDAMEEGRIRIKFQREYSEHLDNIEFTRNRDGIVLSGIPEVDALNRTYNVHTAVKLFDSPALRNGYEWRHREWGFHLWYELRFDTREDIRNIVIAYRNLNRVIEWAEPEYRIELTSYADDLNSAGREGNRRSSSSNEVFSTDFLSGQTEGYRYSDHITNPGSPGETRYRNDEDRDLWNPDDPYLLGQWHYHNIGQFGGTHGADIDLLAAWDIEKGNDAVVVAVVDGGIQYDHPDLAANLWTHPAYPYHGYNFVDNSIVVTPHYHGVHVAGTVAAVNNNDTGVAGVAGGSGTGDGVRLMSCQVYAENGSGGHAQALIFGADNGAAISQNSWGWTSPGVYSQAVLDAIDYFNINGGGDVLDGGITIVAAGNQNSSGSYYPGCYAGAFSVAATNYKDQKTYYSTYDTWVDISAPGGESGITQLTQVLSTYIDSDYGYMQGTSMSCPHVSGVAALVISYAYRNGIILTNSELADLLRDTADDHYDVNPDYIGMLGTGRVNAYRALMELVAVKNPLNFAASTISEVQIDLLWERTDNNNVMLLWSSDDIFGVPSNGASYSPGELLPGGGTVLYRGSGTTYNHTGLNEATRYYYRAFSYNSSNDYSRGRTIHAATDYDYFTLPFTENFDQFTNLPDYWQIVDHQGTGEVWLIGKIEWTHLSGLEATTGNYAYMNSDMYGRVGSQNTDLITPRLNLSEYTAVNVDFTHYFMQWLDVSTATFSYSIDDGNTWTVVNSWSTDTPNPAFFNRNIYGVAGEETVRFKWHYEGVWGFFWCIDDIVITGEYIVGSNMLLESYTLNGDGENTPQFDELIGIDILLANTGNEGATNVLATLSTDSPEVMIIDGQQHFGDIAATSTLSIENAFTFQIAADITDQTGIDFLLLITSDSQDDLTYEISIIVNAPDLQVTDFEVILMNEMIFTIENSGLATSPDGTATLSIDHPGISVNNPVLELYSFAPNSCNQLFYSLSLGNIENNTVVPVTLIMDYGAYQTVYSDYFTVNFDIVEDFETGDFVLLPWQHSGAQDWYIVSDEVYEGNYAARSGNLANNESSVLEVTLDITDEGIISFYRKVSSGRRAGLKFYIDGVEKGSWSGNVNWSEVTYNVEAGTRTFRWEYINLTPTEGSQCAWIDYILFPNVQLAPEPNMYSLTIVITGDGTTLPTEGQHLYVENTL